MPPKKVEVEVKPLLGRVGTNLKVGIVGVPNVGKSTFFNVLTKSQAAAENFPFCTIDPNENNYVESPCLTPVSTTCATTTSLQGCSVSRVKTKPAKIRHDTRRLNDMNAFKMSGRNLFASSLRSDSYDTIVPKKGSKSQIWSYFGLPADADGNIIDPGLAVCHTCRREVGCKGGSTSNMRSHIRNHHSSLFKQILLAEHSRKTSASFLSSNSPSTSKRCKKEANFEGLRLNEWLGEADLRNDENCTKALTKCLVLENLPTSLISRPNFRSFVYSLNPSFQLPDQRYFCEKAIPEMYQLTANSVRRILSSKIDYIALTCDYWTSTSGQHYMAVTANFLDSDFELISVCLKCSQFLSENSAVELVELIKNILDEWGLRLMCVTACTVDHHTSTVTDAIKCLNLHHVPCFGRSLGASLNRTLELDQVERALTRLRKLRWFMLQNVPLGRQSEESDRRSEFSIKQWPPDSPNNWNSTLNMCRFFFDNQLEITEMLQSDSIRRLPDVESLKILECLTEVLKPLEELAGHISGDSNLIASSVVPVLYYTNQLLKVNPDEFSIKTSIKETALEELEVYYRSEDLKNLLKFCTFCDPRYRLQFFSDDDKERVRKEAHKAIVTLSSNLEPSEQQSTFDLSMLWSGNDSNDVPTSPKPKKGIATLLEKLVSDTSKPAVNEIRSVDDRVEEELTRFLQMPPVPLDSSPLLWWKTNAVLFPLLQKLAKKYLIVQGSCVPGDNVFGQLAQAFHSLRNSLPPNNVEMQIFIAQNKKYIDFVKQE